MEQGSGLNSILDSLRNPTIREGVGNSASNPMAMARVVGPSAYYKSLKRYISVLLSRVGVALVFKQLECAN